MTPESYRCRRRSFLKQAITGAAAGYMAGSSGLADESAMSLTDEHLRAVNRRRRITVQYDGYNALGKEWDRWLKYRFHWLDAPGVQIDSVWWDIQPLLKGFYPTPPDSLIYHWPDAQTDIAARLVDETRKRGLEVFWNHRISEVDLKPPNTGGGWTEQPHPLKQEHPDWVLDTWWPHGLWNLSVDAVRQYKVDLLRHVVTTYPLDGIQLDFARHVPCLPVGRQWELRHHITDFVRAVRQMTLDVAAERRRPILLAARVPRSLKGCCADGFDVASWAQQNLIDIFTLGSRSIEVDIEGFRRITADRPIKLQPCLDDHHSPDGYRCPPIEVFRGTFANWWQQGADSVMTFNWASAEAEWCQEMGGEVAPLSQLDAYREVGSTTTLDDKDKTFVVERRGGYPWADGYFNHNSDSPLPKTLAGNGRQTTLTVRIADPIRARADRVRGVALDLVLFGAAEGDQFDVGMNGVPLEETARDPQWKDPQIFSPKPSPASGGRFDRYRIDARQRLLRLQYAITPQCCLVGKNQVTIRRRAAVRDDSAGDTAVEKLEVRLQYK